MKRLLVVSDLHCGSRAGLTPPAWFVSPERNEKCAEYQRENWSWYCNELNEWGPYDVLLANGDLIDGRQPKQGGMELVEPDVLKQTEMACVCLKQALRSGYPTKFYFAYGTGYHVGHEENLEDLVCKEFNGQIYNHYWFKVHGKTVDFKHKIGGSSIPHGRFTAAAREGLWNALWADAGRQPHADLLVRGHVHYFGLAANSRMTVVTCPALQWADTRYGARECSGLVDFGFLTVDFQEDGAFEVRPHFHVEKCPVPEEV